MRYVTYRTLHPDSGVGEYEGVVRPRGFEPLTFCSGSGQIASFRSFHSAHYCVFAATWGICSRSFRHPNAAVSSIKHVVFPVDFSERSKGAVPFVAEMARQSD